MIKCGLICTSGRQGNTGTQSSTWQQFANPPAMAPPDVWALPITRPADCQHCVLHRRSLSHGARRPLSSGPVTMYDHYLHLGGRTSGRVGSHHAPAGCNEGLRKRSARMGCGGNLTIRLTAKSPFPSKPNCSGGVVGLLGLVG